MGFIDDHHVDERLVLSLGMEEPRQLRGCSFSILFVLPVARRPDPLQAAYQGLAVRNTCLSLAQFLQQLARVDDRCIDRELRSQRSEEHTSELQSLMRISYAVFCLKKKKQII